MNGTNRNNVWLAIGVALTVLAGCEDKPAPESGSGGQAGSAADQQPAPEAQLPADHPPVTPAAPADGGISAGGLHWDVPDGWNVEAPANTMRLAQLAVETDSGRCTAYFNISGGGVEDNIARWSGQVTDQTAEPVRADLTVAGVPVTTVQFEGTYLDGPPMGQQTPRPGWMLRGAIIQGPQGLVFIKMYGPAEAMGACAGGWDAMIQSMTAG